MKRTASIIVSVVLLLAGNGVASGFSAINHATVAYIAEQHMTPDARKNFRKAFDNHPLVEFASYPDFFRAVYLVNGARVSHGMVLDENMYPVHAREGKALGAYDGLLRAIDQLSDYKNLDDSTKYVALGFLVHFMGDSHCPGHIKYADGRHKKKSLLYKADLTNGKTEPEKIGYHGFWDGWCSDQRYPTSFIERSLYFDICNEKEIREIQKGTVEDWLHASAIDCKDVYDINDDQIVDKVYVLRKAEVVASQIRNAGYRLAAIMNQLFAK